MVSVSDEKRTMAGRVVEVLPNASVRVEVAGEPTRTVIARQHAELRTQRVALHVGDRVELSITPPSARVLRRLTQRRRPRPRP